MSDAPIVIVPYRSFGTPDTLFVKGRVLHDKPVSTAEAERSAWSNLRDALRRIDSDEVSGARVGIHFDDQEWEVVADNEGYFTHSLPLARPVEKTDAWYAVQLHLLEPALGEPLPYAEAQVLVPPPTARYGVISDIDDTILETNATSLLRSALVTLLENAATRTPFPGVAALYQALQAGANGNGRNPIFYVSSSPWNLYDFLVEFMEFNGIPAGPIFLRDYGLSKITSALSHQAKLAPMHWVLDTYPELAFVLMGDSGQRDPELYSQLLRDYPDRIKAIYIRDVSDDKRDAAVDALAEEAAALGVPMIRAADSAAMAASAAALGLVTPAAVEFVRNASEEPPAP